MRGVKVRMRVNAFLQRSSLSSTIKDTSTIMRNPTLHILRQKGLHMIVLVYLIVLLRELVPTIFCMVHPYIAIYSFFTLVRTYYYTR